MITVEIDTPLGVITADLDDIAAPVTVANLLRYIDAGLFAGGVFWRSVRLDNQPGADVKIEVVQADIHPDRGDEQFAQIALERTRDTGLRHVDGALSMARLDPDSALASFFICVGEQPELDFGGNRNPDGQGFAAFGRVRAGASMDVVRAIHRAPCSVDGNALDSAFAQMADQMLTPPITISAIRRRP